MNYEAICKAFEKHGFSTAFFATKEEARDYLAGKLTGRAIGFGGSITLREMGLYEELIKKNAVAWHHATPGEEVRRMETRANVFITSANAVSETGEIINVDGAGNRVAMTCYGPDEIYFVVGRNKIAPTRDAAIERCKNVACPKNAQRFKLNTPCAAKGDKCYNCNSPQRICNITVIHDRPSNCIPTEIIFVDEDLGY